MWTTIVLGALLCVHVADSFKQRSSADYKEWQEDPRAAKKFIGAIKSDVFVISHKSLVPKRSQEAETETIFSLKFPGTKHEFHLKLDRVNKKMFINALIEGQNLTEGWQLKNGILSDPLDELKSVHIGVIQDITGAKFQLHIECQDHGTVAMTKSLRQMYSEAKSKLQMFRLNKFYNLEVHRDSRLDEIVKKDTHCHPELLWDNLNDIPDDDDEKMLGDDPRDMRRMRENELDPRYQSRELTPSGRSDIPIGHECDESYLIKMINELTTLVKRLQQELEAQRAETRALRDYIERCNICRPGEEYNK